MKEKRNKMIVLMIVMSTTLMGMVLIVPNVSAQGEIRVTVECFSTSMFLPDAVTRENVVIAGEQWIARITVTNLGPSSVSDVVVNNTIPDGVKYLNNTANGTLQPYGSNGALLCELGDLFVGESRSFEVAYLVDSGLLRFDEDGEGLLCNTATATANTTFDGQVTDSGSDCDFVKERADLIITKMSKPDMEVRAGETFTYTILVENLGPSWARGVYIDDDIIASDEFEILQLIDDPARRDRGTVTNRPPAPQTGNITRFELLEPLEPITMDSGAGRWRIQMEVGADETQDINNIVRVYTGPMSDEMLTQNYTTGTIDPDESNNQALDYISVLDTSDLELMIETDLDIVTAGNLLRYSIRNITNKGPSVAPNVIVKCNLPAEVEIVAVVVSKGDCKTGTPGDPSDPTMCIIDKLVAGERATMTIFVRVKPDVPINPVLPADQPAPYGRGRIFCDAWVYSDNYDPDMGDNLDTRSTDVKFEADLQVFKNDVPDSVIAGEILTYEVIVNNAGPSDAQDVLLIDSLPDEVEFISLVVIDDPAFNEEAFIVTSDNAVICELGDISVGTPPLNQKNIFITVRVKPDTPNGTIITNNAEAYSAMITYDPNTTNNILSDGCTECIENTTVVTEADLEIQKVSLPVKASTDNQIKYTIEVINHGPSDAQGVSVTDFLPKGVLFEVETLCNCTFFDECPGILNCSIGTLRAGESRVFEIWVKVLGYGRCCGCGVPVGTMMVNEVRVMSTTVDPVLGNNVATAKTLKIKGSGEDGGGGQWYLFGQILLVGGLVSAAAVITYRKKQDYHP